MTTRVDRVPRCVFERAELDAESIDRVKYPFEAHFAVGEGDAGGIGPGRPTCPGRAAAHDQET